MTFFKCNKDSSFIFKWIFLNIAEWFKINAEKEICYLVRNNFRFIWIQCFPFNTFVNKLLTLNLFLIVNINIKSKESNNKWPNSDIHAYGIWNDTLKIMIPHKQKIRQNIKVSISKCKHFISLIMVLDKSYYNLCLMGYFIESSVTDLPTIQSEAQETKTGNLIYTYDSFLFFIVHLLHLPLLYFSTSKVTCMHLPQVMLFFNFFIW